MAGLTDGLEQAALAARHEPNPALGPAKRGATAHGLFVRAREKSLRPTRTLAVIKRRENLLPHWLAKAIQCRRLNGRL